MTTDRVPTKKTMTVWCLLVLSSIILVVLICVMMFSEPGHGNPISGSENQTIQSK